jgi:hypothetical protein
MQSTSICTNCGSEIPAGARFCRSCGHRSSQFNSGSVTEGTTRLLETQEPRPDPFQQNVTDYPGGLAPATSRISVEALPTSRSLETNPKPTNWLLISSMTVAVLALIAVLILTLRDRSATSVTPPVVIRPDIPTIQIPQPPVIPQPPRGLTPGGSGAISREYIYPGAETTMEITGADDGNVLQLETKDSFDKVVDWYTAKLKPTSTMRREGPSVILAGGEVTAIINNLGTGTSIMLARGDD